MASNPGARVINPYMYLSDCVSVVGIVASLPFVTESCDPLAPASYPTERKGEVSVGNRFYCELIDCFLLSYSNYPLFGRSRQAVTGFIMVMMKQQGSL